MPESQSHAQLTVLTLNPCLVTSGGPEPSDSISESIGSPILHEGYFTRSSVLPASHTSSLVSLSASDLPLKTLKIEASEESLYHTLLLPHPTACPPLFLPCCPVPRLRPTGGPIPPLKDSIPPSGEGLFTLSLASLAFLSLLSFPHLKKQEQLP